MCFGSTKAAAGEQAPRPAQQRKGQDGNELGSATSSSVPQSQLASKGPALNQQQYAPPTGSPQHQQQYAPPSGPPAQQSSKPPDYYQSASTNAAHDWEAAVPDTSLFPPPPALFSGHDTSPVNNASEADADAAEEWCAQHPLRLPMTPDATATTALEVGNIRLIEPAGFNGQLSWLAPGHWHAATRNNSPDRCIIGYPPLYMAALQDPARSGRRKTIYYEVRILADSRNTSLAIGFTALPYPSFRLPGWHRGSMGVHGDDGRKYINDRWGGKDFTHEFKAGETLGVGMTFVPSARKGIKTDTTRSDVDVSIFFTRNGVRTGGWDLHEETDAEQDLPVTGLEGFHDLSCAIGVFDGVDFDVIFDAAKWRHRPSEV
ncbi:hypothetical protein E4U38_005254 [Claviceps purpurea]|nr:hypothetical protein E4U38_005254 [Claviceps purpurea]